MARYLERALKRLMEVNFNHDTESFFPFRRRRVQVALKKSSHVIFNELGRVEVDEADRDVESLDPKVSTIQVDFIERKIWGPFTDYDLKVTKSPRVVEDLVYVIFIFKDESHEVILEYVGCDTFFGVPSLEDCGFKGSQIYGFISKNSSNKCEFIVKRGCCSVAFSKALKVGRVFNESINFGLEIHDW